MGFTEIKIRHLGLRVIKKRLSPRFKNYSTSLRFIVRKKEEVTIVTAADDSHFRSSINLLESIQLHEPNIQVLYFDLGLTIAQRLYINEKFSNIQLFSFPYDKFPKHFNVRINAGEYAWKAACIDLAWQITNSGVIWFDAGNVITQNLDLMRKIIRVNGIFIMEASTTIRDFTHPECLKYFRYSNSLNLRQFSAAAIGFSRKSLDAKIILDYWLLCFKERQVIAPIGSSRANHRQDQAILTLIILENEEMNLKIRRQIKRNNDIAFYHFLIHQDVESK